MIPTISKALLFKSARRHAGVLSVLNRSFVSVASQTCQTQVSVICTHPLFCFCSESDMLDTSKCYLYSSVLCFCSKSDMLDTSKCYLYSSVLLFL